MKELLIKKFCSTDIDAWDEFIIHKALNATFLQSRRFLSYHPENKYIDHSLMFYFGDSLVALCPANEIEDENGKSFYSHAGSSYGGIIISNEIVRTEKILLLLDVFEKYLRDCGFTYILLKQNNPLMNIGKIEVLDFCLYYLGYHEYKELNLYIDYNEYDKQTIENNFSKRKKRQIKKALEYGFQLKELFLEKELDSLIEVLSKNLKKYNILPYHSTGDLLELKRRFPNEIQYWGADYNGKIIAIAMVFIFYNSGCVHTHYLAADPDYIDLYPMTFIYFKMIEYYSKLGYKKLSWGITTEHLGLEINNNLTNTKEEFGSNHSIISVFSKRI